MSDATIVIEDLLTSPEKTVKVVKVAGQLDESNVDEKIQEIYKVVESVPKNLNLIFDLENLVYMNSESIGYLTDIYGKITENGGQVVIASAKSNILDILQVVGLTQLIKTFDSLNQAKEALTGAAPAAQPAQAAPEIQQAQSSTETYNLN